MEGWRLKKCRSNRVKKESVKEKRGDWTRTYMWHVLLPSREVCQSCVRGVSKGCSEESPYQNHRGAGIHGATFFRKIKTILLYSKQKEHVHRSSIYGECRLGTK